MVLVALILLLIIAPLMDATTTRFLSIVSNSCDARELVEWFDSLPQTKPKLAVLKDQIKFLNEMYPLYPSSSLRDTPLHLALWNRHGKGSARNDNLAIVSTSYFFLDETKVVDQKGNQNLDLFDLFSLSPYSLSL